MSASGGIVWPPSSFHVLSFSLRDFPADIEWPTLNISIIINRTIGLLLGPSTAFYKSFLQQCTLTNKAVDTIWRGLVQTISEETRSAKFRNVFPFRLHSLSGCWECWFPVNRFNKTSWMVVTPTDGPKTARNHYVMEFFESILCYIFRIYWLCKGFCHRNK